jgi:hypothetical protein
MLLNFRYAFLMAVFFGHMSELAEADCDHCVDGIFTEFNPCNCGPAFVGPGACPGIGMPCPACDSVCCAKTGACCQNDCNSVVGYTAKLPIVTSDLACIIENPHKCCQLVQGLGGSATYNPPGDARWHVGKGDFQPGAGHVCPQLQSTNATAKLNVPLWAAIAYFPGSALPTLSSDGRLAHGKHTQLDFGRPGRCAGDLNVRVHANVLNQSSSISWVGECCDLCAETPGCTAWNMEHRNCTIFDSPQEDIRWSFGTGKSVFSGVKVAPSAEPKQTIFL